MRIGGTVLAASLAATEGMLLAQGQWQEALPLHLCSVSALVALALAFGAGRSALDFLWYLGMPGALLALLFPAPAVSRWQMLFDLAYAVTHAMIIVIPACRLARGARVRRGRALRMWGWLHLLAAAAYVVNVRLGTDYLFLMAPPAGTPLCAVYALGGGAYLLALEALAGALLLVTGPLAQRLCPKLFD